MGYMHIENLYKRPADILMFKEVYALEKIHGTSAHISWKQKDVLKTTGAELKFFSGGASHELFVSLFDKAALTQKFLEIGQTDATIFGEAYGGKCQGMSGTYGKSLKFVVFDVKIGDSWLSVPQAEEVALKLGLEFVHYTLIEATHQAIDRERDAPSQQAKRNGILEDKMREGIVLRPPIELTKNNGGRIIAKHKRDEFKETATPRAIEPDKIIILEQAQAIADEWVTPMRLAHVLEKMPAPLGIENTGDVIRAMLEDVKREAGPEIVWSKDAERAVGTAAVKMFKARLKTITTDPCPEVGGKL